MAAVTTRHGGSQPKPFTWSYSRLKNFESCAKRHWEIDIAKTVKEEDSTALKWGNSCHDHAAKRCGPQRIPLPPGFETLEPWCARVVTGEGNILVENKMALTREFAACGFFDGNVWFRAVVDVIKLKPPVALVCDWKTGKILEDSVQLALTAACVFAKYPEIKRIRSEFIWIKENATTREDFTPADMPGLWKLLWPRIQAMEHAHNTTTYPAQPGRLCRKWCPVGTCPHHGTSG
jgi:hypothetical protein